MINLLFVCPTKHLALSDARLTTVKKNTLVHTWCCREHQIAFTKSSLSFLIVFFPRQPHSLDPEDSRSVSLIPICLSCTLYSSTPLSALFPPSIPPSISPSRASPTSAWQQGSLFLNKTSSSGGDCGSSGGEWGAHLYVTWERYIKEKEETDIKRKARESCPVAHTDRWLRMMSCHDRRQSRVSL